LCSLPTSWAKESEVEDLETNRRAMDERIRI
jgi:hypothetical protein